MIAKTGGFPFYKRPKTLHRPKGKFHKSPRDLSCRKKDFAKRKVLFSGITRRKRYHRKMRTEGSDQTDLIVQNGCRKNFRFTLDNIGYIPYTDYRI